MASADRRDRSPRRFTIAVVRDGDVIPVMVGAASAEQIVVAVTDPSLRATG